MIFQESGNVLREVMRHLGILLFAKLHSHTVQADGIAFYRAEAHYARQPITRSIT